MPLVALSILGAGGGFKAFAQATPGTIATNEVRIVEIQGTVQVFPAGSQTGSPAQINEVLHPLDRVQTADNSRVALRWSDQSIVPFGASTELEILPPGAADEQSGLHLIHGVLSFFHRDKPGRIHIITRGAVAGVEGTEFVLAANDDGDTTLSVVDGKVKFGNDTATLLLTNGQQAEVAPGKAPARTTGFIANNLLQWCFYYPAVLDLNDLSLTTTEQNDLAASLTAYRAGDLPAALAKYPEDRTGVSANEQIYHAALLLSVGEVDKTEAILAGISNPDAHTQNLEAALRSLIAAVKRQPAPAGGSQQLASEWLANSYLAQSSGRGDVSLKAALQSAQKATQISPQFGFAWERVAELEFSFGQTDKALKALDQSLALSPRNAQALALKGFIFAARSQPHQAIASFDDALAVDSSLGNAWLGRGLSRIRLGDKHGGREDLLVAAALEPQRSELRSYLGKAYAVTGDDSHARKELALAKKLDPNDPTSWLYLALVDQQDNLINNAIRELEKSKELNGNRSVYRSQLLLDQDQAVRSANLASIYRDDGMFDVSIREAQKAVNSDYANYSAHRFLADSYQELTDPNLVNQRYETPTESEYLLANLLAPAGAGMFSPTLSEKQYSSLFDQNHVGVVSATEYLSRGAWDESGSQYGRFNDFSYDLEGYYHWDPGQLPNSDIEVRQLDLTLKQQLTPKDSLYFDIEQLQSDSGDTAEAYNAFSVDRGVRYHEDQDPIMLIGYHHEWSPGSHTILLAGRLEDTLNFYDQGAQTLLEVFNGPTLKGVETDNDNEYYKGHLDIYTAELQQIFEQPDHTTILGARVQSGHFHTSISQTITYPPTGFITDPERQQDMLSEFHRISAYGYHTWQIFDPLQVIGGLTYDWIKYPDNFRNPPFNFESQRIGQLSPKIGAIWTPAKNTTVRFAWTHSASGASLDQSFQLEPSQVAGFVQTYRSIMPESVVGGLAGTRNETYDLSLEQNFPTGTYLALSGEILNSKVTQSIGDYVLNPAETFAYATNGLPQVLEYQEQTLKFTANQLVGSNWSFGAQYSISKAALNENFTTLPNGLLSDFGNTFAARQRLEGFLQQANFTAIYNHPSGFFSQGQVIWFHQYSDTSSPAFPVIGTSDAFCQLNAEVGWRFWHRQAEASIALLNVTDVNYQLNPINIYDSGLPRGRTLAVKFQFSF